MISTELGTVQCDSCAEQWPCGHAEWRRFRFHLSAREVTSRCLACGDGTVRWVSDTWSRPQ